MVGVVVWIEFVVEGGVGAVVVVGAVVEVVVEGGVGAVVVIVVVV